MRFDWEDEEEPTKPKPEPEKEKGSAGRYRVRLERFKADGQPLPSVRHHALWLLHNCVAHPWMAVLPGRASVDFHDRTSDWLNHKPAFVPSVRMLFRSTPEIPKPLAWFFHNTVGHVAIGLFPTERMFAFHDRTAKAMDVPNWV